VRGKDDSLRSLYIRITIHSPHFCSSSARYVRLIFDEELEPKVVQQRAITAPELLTYFEVYVKMFQADNKSFPKVRPFTEPM
jgi:hypothetical protein